MADGASGDSQDGTGRDDGHRSADDPEDTGGGQRVEEHFERWGRRLGRFVAGAATRVREEAEDIVAEAQSIRRGERD
jgi:hypothetical protein